MNIPSQKKAHGCNYFPIRSTEKGRVAVRKLLEPLWRAHREGFAGLDICSANAAAQISAITSEMLTPPPPPPHPLTSITTLKAPKQPPFASKKAGKPFYFLENAIFLFRTGSVNKILSLLTPVVQPLSPPLFPLVCSSRWMPLLPSLTLLGIFPLQGKMASIYFHFFPDCKASWCVLSLIWSLGSSHFPVRPKIYVPLNIQHFSA